jgi:PilZ domain
MLILRAHLPTGEASAQVEEVVAMPAVVAGQVAREVLPGGLTALPSVNTRITVSPGADADGPGRRSESRTIVEDLRLKVGRRHASAEVVIAQPSFAGDLHGETPGAGYLLRWTTDRGIHEVAGTYVERERIGPRLIGWRLHVEGPVTRIQRRAHARVDVTVPVHVLDGDGGVVRGYTVNLSEGGVLMSLEMPAPSVGSEIVVRFALGSGGSQETFVLGGRVVRQQPTSGPRAGVFVAVAFDTPDAHGDRLRPHLFAHQLRARQIGLR